MKDHTKIYMKFFGYDKSDFIPSELSGNQAQAIHHIKCRGMGGNPKGDRDSITNLMALTAGEHEEFGDKAQYMEYLQSMHMQFVYKVKFKHLTYLEFIAVWPEIGFFNKATK